MPAKKHKRPIFYDILGVTPDATADEIKKAYRKQARAKHPDKNKGDPKAAEEFKQLTAAYDILSDPKKRKEYDALGDSGVKLFAASVNDMGAVSPEALSAMMRTQLETLSPAQRGLVVCLFCCTFALVWIFPVFLCLRADDTTHWNWAIVFIPLWIVDLFLLPCFFMNDANGKPMAKFTVVTSIVLFIMQQIFLVLRLEKTVDWPWIVVLLPWAFLEVIGMWNELQGAHERFFAFQQVQTADRNAMTYSPNFFIFVLWRCTNHLARLGFAITLALKVDDSIRANWFVVMLPLWLGFAAQAGFLCWRRAVVVPPEAAAERSHLDEDSPTAAVPLQIRLKTSAVAVADTYFY